ncbi:hypothetical protein D3C87_1839590 [compost metagenome]
MPVRALSGAQLRELHVGGEVAVPQQVRDGLERLRGGELLHRIPPVQQRVRLRIDLRDRRVVHDDAGEALLDVGFGHDLAPLLGPVVERA